MAKQDEGLEPLSWDGILACLSESWPETENKKTIAAKFNGNHVGAAASMLALMAEQGLIEAYEKGEYRANLGDPEQVMSDSLDLVKRMLVLVSARYRTHSDVLAAKDYLRKFRIADEEFLNKWPRVAGGYRGRKKNKDGKPPIPNKNGIGGIVLHYLLAQKNPVTSKQALAALKNHAKFSGYSVEKMQKTMAYLKARNFAMRVGDGSPAQYKITPEAIERIKKGA